MKNDDKEKKSKLNANVEMHFIIFVLLKMMILMRECVSVI